MNFAWHPTKAEANFQKHGVTFEEATTAFDDPLFITFADPGHSVGENCFILMGQSERERLLVVAYTERAGVSRLVTAREAIRKERRFYEEDC